MRSCLTIIIGSIRRYVYFLAHQILIKLIQKYYFNKIKKNIPKKKKVAKPEYEKKPRFRWIPPPKPPVTAAVDSSCDAHDCRWRPILLGHIAEADRFGKPTVDHDLTEKPRANHVDCPDRRGGQRQWDCDLPARRGCGTAALHLRRLQTTSCTHGADHRRTQSSRLTHGPIASSPASRITRGSEAEILWIAPRRSLHLPPNPLVATVIFSLKICYEKLFFFFPEIVVCGEDDEAAAARVSALPGERWGGGVGVQWKGVFFFVLFLISDCVSTYMWVST